MRVWIPVLLAAAHFVNLLTLSKSVLADETPAIAPPVAQSENDTLARTQARRMWEIDGALFKTLSSQDPNQLGTARLLVRRFLNESLSLGLDYRYWPSGSYPLADTTDESSAWAAGGSGQLYLFRNDHIGGYVGASLLWVPTYSEAAFCPELGFKWFASSRFAVGLSYWIMTDLSAYTTSFEPKFTGKSRQSLGLELSVYL